MVSSRPFLRLLLIRIRRIGVHSRSLLAAALLCASAAHSTVPAGYPGTAYQGKVQEIPGRVFLSDFDQGPKEMVWHDFEAKNQWACKVRDSTGVGLQLMGQGGDKGDTKEADSLVKARLGKCYLAQTNSGDWTKYTVKVKQAGTYRLAMLSAAAETQVPFVAASILSDKDSAGTGKLTLPITTYFHHWVYTRDLSRLSLDTGTQVLRFDIPGNGPMNIDYIDFEYAGPAGLDGTGASAPAGSPGLSVDRLLREDDGSVLLEFSAPGREAALIRAFDASGTVLASGTVHPSEAGKPGRLTFRTGLPAHGLVFVELRQGAGRTIARTFLIR
ncbi:MAG: carbohydrate-binding protein [Fibrobacteres bacterium]|nr:carbohydrate-binding protein [Fibrobacterota bacterium]